MNSQRVQQLIRELPIEIGEDPQREGPRKTPARVAEMYAYMTSSSVLGSFHNDRATRAEFLNLIE